MNDLFAVQQLAASAGKATRLAASVAAAAAEAAAADLPAIFDRLAHVLAATGGSSRGPEG